MNPLERFRSVKTFILDVDGVLTDGRVLVLEDGKLLRQMSIRDGYALKTATRRGYRVCAITGGRSEGVRRRLEGLGLKDVYLGQSDKRAAYEELVELYELDEAEILYMGDDLPDYPIMRRVGLPCCPADAAPEVLEVAQYISPYAGGQGCVRDVIEKVLRLQEQWGEEPAD